MANQMTNEELVKFRRAENIAKPLFYGDVIKKEQLLVVKVGPDKYGIHYTDFSSVTMMLNVTYLPLLKTEFLGVCAHDDTLWPVIDSGQLFHINDDMHYENLVFIELAKCRMAMAVENIIDLVNYDESAKASESILFQHEKHEYVSNIYQHDIAVLDMSAVVRFIEELSFEL